MEATRHDENQSHDQHRTDTEQTQQPTVTVTGLPHPQCQEDPLVQVVLDCVWSIDHALTHVAHADPFSMARVNQAELNSRSDFIACDWTAELIHKSSRLQP